MSSSIRARRWQACLASIAGLALASVAGAQVTEIEPNETKAQATPATLDAGVGGTAAQLRGNSTGAATTAGATSQDTWRVKTAAAPLGIYRYDLALDSTTAGHTVTIRGLSQSGGVISTTSDIAFQTGSTITSPPRFVTWYGFGKQEEIYYRVTGTTSTSADYTSTLTRTPVTPIVIPGSVSPGAITVRVNNVTASPDTEFWLYDSNFNALVNNVPAGSGPGGVDNNLAGGGLSSAVRSLPPGTYYIAVGAFNLGNNQPAATGDFATGNVLDFPDAIASSVVNRSAVATVNVSLTDAGGVTITSSNFDFPANSTGIVQFAQFTVAVPVGPVVTACTASPSAAVPGGNVTLSTNVVPGTSGSAIASVTANLSAFGLGSAVPFTAGGGGAYSLTFAVPAGQANGSYPVTFTATDALAQTGTCSANVIVSPAGDDCANALPIALGTLVNGSTVAATASTIAALCTGSSLDVYYVFTPPTTGVYAVTLTPATTAHSLSVGTSCTPFDDTLFCAAISAAVTNSTGLSLTAGVPVIIRVAVFSGDQGAFTLIVNPLVSGACCSNTTGACTLTASNACTGGTFQGANTTCTPSPCPAFGACCNNTAFTCSVGFQTACTGTNVFQGNGTTCTPFPCPPRPNDECTGAVALSNFGVAIHSTTGGTTGTLAPSCGVINQDVWYKWTAPAAGTVRFTTENGADRNAIYDGGPGAGTCPTGGDISCAATGGFVEANVVAGNTYFIQTGQTGTTAVALGGLDLWFVRAATGSCCVGSTCTIVSANECTGTFTAGGVCNPDTATVNSYVGTPATVVDFATATGGTLVSQTINVPDSFTVSDVEVDITGTHTFVGDLIVSLEKDGRRIELFNRPRRDSTSTVGSSANLSTAVLTFSDAGAQTLHDALPTTAPTAVAAGVYKPGSISGLALSFKNTFNGVPASGNWTLTVSDWAGIDTGNVAWTLRLKQGGPSNCAGSTSGRCCVGARCAIVASSAACVSGGGSAGSVFSSGATSCNATGNFSSPCCYANYNKAGGITVQDIFDFLTDWFSNSPNANVEGNGTALPTVQDIFDFLAAWFTGGCS